MVSFTRSLSLSRIFNQRRKMKLITRNTDYALRAICYIAKQKKMVAVSELVKALQMPRPFMRKILQQLSAKGVLLSFKGQAGGFKLKVPPGQIYAHQVMEIFQGPLDADGCFLQKNVCPNKGKCVLRKKLNAIEDVALAQLRRITIASLMEG